MAKSAAEIALLAADVQAVQALQVQVRQPMKDLLDELMETARVFVETVGSDEWRWFNSSRFSELANTGAIGYGKYEFVISSKGDFLLETEDSYGSFGQTVLTVAEAADFENVLKSEFASRK